MLGLIARTRGHENSDFCENVYLSRENKTIEMYERYTTHRFGYSPSPNLIYLNPKLRIKGRVPHTKKQHKRVGFWIYPCTARTLQCLILLAEQNAVKSDDLSRVTSAVETIGNNFRNCLARGKDQVKRFCCYSVKQSIKQLLTVSL